MRELLVLALLVVCADVVARPEPDTRATFEKLDVYFRCATRAAITYAESTATATEAADAAQGSCSNEFDAFQAEMRSAFMRVGMYDQTTMDTVTTIAKDRYNTIHAKLVALVLDLRTKKK